MEPKYKLGQFVFINIYPIVGGFVEEINISHNICDGNIVIKNNYLISTNENNINTSSYYDEYRLSANFYDFIESMIIGFDQLNEVVDVAYCIRSVFKNDLEKILKIKNYMEGSNCKRYVDTLISILADYVYSCAELGKVNLEHMYILKHDILEEFENGIEAYYIPKKENYIVGV